MTEHLTWHEATISKQDRHLQNEHKSTVVWLTGLSGSGKSTLANAVNLKLYNKGIHSYVLDGDNVRQGLNKGLGFSEEDRKENIRRIGEVAKLFVDSGHIVLTAFISPFHSDRRDVRQLLNEGEFIEVYVKCSLAECERRDPKGLYKKAKAGEIPEFTGISSPYEAPECPELTIETDRLSIEDASELIINYLRKKQIIPH